MNAFIVSAVAIGILILIVVISSLAVNALLFGGAFLVNLVIEIIEALIHIFRK